MKNILFLPIDSRGAAIPYLDTANQIELSEPDLNTIVYVTHDLKDHIETINYQGLGLVDDFSLTDFITGHKIYESADNTLGLFVAARNVMNAWIPNAMQVIENALSLINPTETLIVSNTVGFMHLGHFLLNNGFEHFVVMEPYRMLDWKHRWKQDTSQFFPGMLPNEILLRMLFGQQGKAMAEKFANQDIQFSYRHIKQAIIDQVLTYSPQLSLDTSLASGYPYPEDLSGDLDATITTFIQQKRSENKLVFVFTLGSMDIKEAEKRHIIHEFILAVQHLGASAIILGASVDSDDNDILFANYFVRYNAIFPKADLIIQHCGSGTTHLALWSGTPVFAIPFLRDQYDWAKQLEHLGMLVANVPKSQFTKDKFIQQFKENFNQDIIKSAKLAGDTERAQYNDGRSTVAKRILNTLDSISVK